MDFPASTDPAPLAKWIKARTDLPLDRVALAGPTHVVAVIPRPGSGPVRRALVQGEVIDKAWADQHRFVSWRTDVEVDCQDGRVKSPKGNSYPQRKGKGKATAVAASDDWTAPPPGDPTAGVVRAICSADFQWPLAAASRSVRTPKAGPTPTLVAQQAAEAPIQTGVRETAPEALPDVVVAPAQPQPALAGTAQGSPRPLAARLKAASPPPASRTRIPAPTEKSVPARGGAYAVQVLAASTEARARGELATLGKLFSLETRGLSRKVVPAVVNGRNYYRSMFTGIETAPRAHDLCRAITRLGYQCMVRKL